MLAALDEAMRLGRTVVLATVVGVDGSAPRAAGARMVIGAEGPLAGTIGGGQLEHRVVRMAAEVLETGKPRRFQVHLTRDLGMCCGGAMDVYLEPVLPDDRLVIYGAGHVARPTAAIARMLGFGLTVVDQREELNTEERFEGAARVLSDPRAHARALVSDPRTYLLVTTHDHALDQDLVEILLEREWAWLGVIGSRAKLAKFFLRLRAGGMPEERFSRVNGPVGLDIGAETPAEIAVAITAELVRVRRHADRPPLSLAEIPLPARGGDGIGRAPGLVAPGLSPRGSPPR